MMLIISILPSPLPDIGRESQCVWIASPWVVNSTAVQPFIEQVSNVFRQRVPMIVSAEGRNKMVAD